jgi:tRNA-dihydrouridine synthase B
MRKKLYFAPINFVGNYLYRHMLLENNTDFVFSELIMIDRIENELRNNKLKIIKSDIKKTIFQIGANTNEEIKIGVNTIIDKIKKPIEINLNMGCPHSTFLKRKICGGILEDLELMENLCKSLKNICNEHDIIPSIKIRLGTHPNKIEIEKYLEIAKKAGIKKVYIHARPLRYSYEKSTQYNHLHNIKQKFNNLELIFNGDIDCYEKYKNIINNYDCDGIMIGRAALSNPFIFRNIKNKINSQNTKSFNPIINDSETIISGKTTITKEKMNFIINFINLAIENKENSKLIKTNIIYLTKGISENKEFWKFINKESSLEKIKEIFIKSFYITD